MVVERCVSPKSPDREDKMIAVVSKVRSVTADIVDSRAGSRSLVVNSWLLNAKGGQVLRD